MSAACSGFAPLYCAPNNEADAARASLLFSITAPAAEVCLGAYVIDGGEVHRFDVNLRCIDAEPGLAN